MAAIRSFAFNILFYVGTLVLASVAVILSLLPSDRPVRAMFRLWCGYVVGLARLVLGAKLEILGRENIHPRPALIVSKHQSELDVALMGCVFPDYAAIAMRELDNYPLIGRIVRKLGHIKVTVDGDRRNQLPEVVEGARAVHAEGRPVLIYPEGHLMNAGRKHRYRGGVWHIYHELGVPAHPVALDLALVWPRREWRKNVDRRAAMKFLEPIPPGLDKDAFMAELERRIETATNEMIRAHAPKETLAAIEFDYELGRITDGA